MPCHAMLCHAMLAASGERKRAGRCDEWKENSPSIGILAVIAVVVISRCCLLSRW